jgi:hypothetical protein
MKNHISNKQHGGVVSGLSQRIPELNEYSRIPIGDPEICNCIQQKINLKVVESKDNPKMLKKYSKYEDSIMGSGGTGNEYCYISQLALHKYPNIFSGNNARENKIFKKIICECNNCDSKKCKSDYSRLCDHIARYNSGKKPADSYTTNLTMNALFDKLDKDSDGCIDVDEFKHILQANDKNLKVLNDLKDSGYKSTESSSQDDSVSNDDG